MFDFIEDPELRAKAQAAYDAQLATLNNATQAKIDEAIIGLKAKNEELLGEKKTIQQRLLEFADIDDPKKAKEALMFLSQSHEAQLIKDGKIDEIIDKRTSQLKSDYVSKIEELTAQLTEVANTSKTYKQKFESKMIDDTLREAALKAGVHPAALADVLLRGRLEFGLSDSTEVEARDADGKLRKNKDGIILTPDVWMEGMKETAPHFWPQSEGAGAMGGGRGGSGGDTTAQLAALAKKGDHAGYRKLREATKK